MYPNRGIGKCYLCLLVHIECNKISLITLPSLWQEFSDITCEFFDLAFTLATFPTFRACTSWYKLRKVFCRFADAVVPVLTLGFEYLKYKLGWMVAEYICEVLKGRLRQ